MRFDNKQFESGIQTSIKSLDDLKKGLNLDDAAQSLTNLDRAGRRFSLAGIADGIDAIRAKFSALNVIGITALANITNSAINAGRRLVSSFTIDPIKMGFSEYETKMNAIQTILTNTQGGQRRVTDSAVSGIKKTSSAAVNAVQEANDSSVKSLQKANEEKLKAYEKTADKELDILEEKQDKESEDLRKANDEEMKLLRQTHEEKLALYDEEYMQKLKVVDEERYNKIKDIDNEIKGINDLTKAEEDELERTRERNKILDLQKRINIASTIEERLSAEKDLAEYIEELNRNKIIKERDNRIEELRTKKDNINEEYDKIREQLKEEYSKKKESENELYNFTLGKLRDEQDEKIKNLNKAHKLEKEQITERITMEKDALRDRLDAEMDALQKRNKAAVNSAQSTGGSTSGAVEKWETVKGSTLEEVNAALAELNKYADLTIYNFAQMTENVGRFTAQGVNLKDSVTAVKGMSNVAAGFGVDAQKMAGATYQISQALGAGRIRLEDWMSMERASMAGPMIQNELLKTAKSMGIVVDSGKAFRDTLQDGWLTTDVFIKTMDRMAKDPALLTAATNVTTFTKLLGVMRESLQSGWATSWEEILGDKNESTALFTGISNSFNNLIQPAEQARNTMLSFWNANGGRDAIIEAITNAFNLLGSILKPIGQAFREIFPAMTGPRLVEISKGLRDFTAQFKITADGALNIKDTFKGLFAVLDIGVKAFKLIASAIGMVIEALLPASGSLLEITGSIGRFLTSLNDSIERSYFMNFALESMSTMFTIVRDVITQAVNAISNALPKLGSILNDIGVTFNKLFGPTTAYASTLEDTGKTFSKVEGPTNTLRKAFDTLGTVLTKVKDVTIKIVTTMKNTLAPIFGFISEKLDSLTMQDIGALLTGSGLLMFAKALSKGISSVDSILANFSKILEEVGDTLKAFQLKVKAEALLKIAIALGILAASLIALSFIDIVDLAKSLGALTIMLTGLIIALKLLNKQSKGIEGIKDVFGQFGNAVQIVGFATGILILAGALKILSSIDAGKLIQAVVALGAIMAMLIGFIKLTNGGDLKASSGGLIAFAIGITILAGALAILAKLEIPKLIQGTIAIATLMTMIAAFIKLTKGGDLATSASGLMGFAIGITILSGALTILGNMDIEKLKQGTIAIATLMTMIGAFITLTKGGDLATSAGGLMGFAIGILVLSGALAILGGLDSDKLKQGGVAIAFLMASIGAFITLTKGGDLATSAGGLIAFAIGIGILTKCLSVLSNMDSVKLGQAAIAISALMAVIAGFINVTRGGDLAGSSAGIIGFAIGLTILSGAVSILASIDPNKITQGVVALTALITVIGAFVSLTKEGDLKESAAGLIGFATGLLIIAGVIAILSALNTEKLIMASTALSAVIAVIGAFVNLTNGVDLKTSAGALIVFSIAIGIMAASLIAVGQLKVGQIIAAGLAISGLILSLTAFITLTSGADLLVSSAGLVLFSGAIMIMAEAINKLGSMDIKTLLVGIGAMAAIFVVLGLASVILAPLTPVILALSASILMLGLGVAAVGVGMLAFSKGLEILASSGKAGGAVLVEIIKNLVALIPETLIILAKGIIDFAKTLGDGAVVLAESAKKIILAVIDTINEVAPNVIDCIVNVVTKWLDAVIKMIPKMVDAGMELILGLLKGVADHIEEIVKAGIDVVLNFVKGVTAKLPAIIDAAFKLVISFINGLATAIDKNHNALYDAVGKLIDAIVKAITDLWPRLVKIGENIISGIIEGIKNMGKALADGAKNVIGSMVNGVKSFLGIKSPSRVFAEIGKYSVMGLAKGLSDYSGLVSNEAINVGNTAVNSLRNAISSIPNILAGDIDMSPTIRPVLDLTDITSGAGRINSMLNQNQGITVSTANIKAASISSGMQPAETVQNGGTPTTINKETPNGSPKPAILQLVLQNGKAIAEYIVDDIDSLMGATNKFNGRRVGL
jgi:tape measure domain-containing protein